MDPAGPDGKEYGLPGERGGAVPGQRAGRFFRASRRLRPLMRVWST